MNRELSKLRRLLNGVEEPKNGEIMVTAQIVLRDQAYSQRAITALTDFIKSKIKNRDGKILGEISQDAAQNSKMLESNNEGVLI